LFKPSKLPASNGRLSFTWQEIPALASDTEGSSLIVPAYSSYSPSCSVIETIVNTLKAKGVELTTPVENQGFGLMAAFKAPGELVM
jgi:hypothetical protein